MIALEATGGFETVVASSFSRCGLSGCRGQSSLEFGPSPRRWGNRAKTNLIDAAVIAHFAEATRPELRAAA